LLMSVIRYLSLYHPLLHYRLWRLPRRMFIYIISISGVLNAWLWVSVMKDRDVGVVGFVIIYYNFYVLLFIIIVYYLLLCGIVCCYIVVRFIELASRQDLLSWHHAKKCKYLITCCYLLLLLFIVIHC
uniref:G_PROTEIN_RECEP_F1_2 domain-containing protein n=1 Tax=Anisakis simplex TaxID=6269 RepID=A0A0M3KC68_ANISI